MAYFLYMTLIFKGKFFKMCQVQKIWELESPAKSPSVCQPPVRRHVGKSITNKQHTPMRAVRQDRETLSHVVFIIVMCHKVGISPSFWCHSRIQKHLTDHPCVGAHILNSIPIDRFPSIILHVPRHYVVISLNLMKTCRPLPSLLFSCVVLFVAKFDAFIVYRIERGNGER